MTQIGLTKATIVGTEFSITMREVEGDAIGQRCYGEAERAAGAKIRDGAERHSR